MLIDLHEVPMRRDYNIGILDTLNTLVLDCHLPFPGLFLPVSAENPGIELDVTIKVPLLDGAFDIRMDLRASRIESRPVWIRVERKRLFSSVLVLTS